MPCNHVLRDLNFCYSWRSCALTEHIPTRCNTLNITLDSLCVDTIKRTSYGLAHPVM
jgi:hypothetical protein